MLCQLNQEKLPGKINFNQKEKEIVSTEIENILKKDLKSVFEVSRRKSIFEQQVLSKEKVWEQHACHQLEKTEPTYHIQPFQNKKSTFNRKYHKEGQMRPQKLIFLHSSVRGMGGAVLKE